MRPATLIRDARLAAGLSQAELARRAGTSQATVCAYERGGKNPSAATLERLLAASGQRLTTTPASRPVRSPGAADLEGSGRSLLEVIELASQLPTSHAGDSAFPGVPPRTAERQ